MDNIDSKQVPTNELDALLRAARAITSSSVQSAEQVNNLRIALRMYDNANEAMAAGGMPQGFETPADVPDNVKQPSER